MAARAIWKGNLKVGSTAVPVKLYAAVQERDVRFHMLKSRTQSRVKQHMVEPDSGKEVETANIRKAYEIEPGTFVVVKKEELDRLKPEESREITLLRFVPESALGPEWYERPYYLGPDAEDGKYFALAQAIRDREVEGIAGWTMRGKSYVGALHEQDGYLTLIKIRHTEEVLSPRELPAPGGRPLSDKELRMAEELVSALEGEFEPETFRDEYRDRLMKFIQAKAHGKRPKLPRVKERRSTASLTDQLEKSLAAAKRPAWGDRPEVTRPRSGVPQQSGRWARRQKRRKVA